MNSDFKELLQVLNQQKVDYLVIGGYAVIHYAQPRLLTPKHFEKRRVFPRLVDYLACKAR